MTAAEEKLDAQVERAINKIRDWLTGPDRAHLRNKWIYAAPFQIYLRKALHLINGERVTCLDLANITITERQRGKGLFKKLLVRLIEINPYKYIFVEGVMNKRIEAHLLRRGDFVKINHGDYPDDFYGPVNK